MAQRRGICPQVVWQCSFAQMIIAVRDKEKRVFSLNLVYAYELYNDNKPCPLMHNPPSPLGEPESKKIGFVTPIFASTEISKSHNKIKMKWYNIAIEHKGAFKTPHFRNTLMS